MTDQSDHLWPLTGKILLSAFHAVLGFSACAIGSMLAYDAIQFGDHHPNLYEGVAVLTCLLGLYALATILSIWNDSRPTYWALGIAIVVGGLGISLGAYAARNSVDAEFQRATNLVGFPMGCGLILTGLAMIWWNEKHATVYCRYRMHLGGVILNTLVAAGTIWNMKRWQSLSHLDAVDTIPGIFLGMQAIWMILLIAATRRFPRKPKDTAGKTACYRT